MRRRKTIFSDVYPTIYLSSYPLSEYDDLRKCHNDTDQPTALQGRETEQQENNYKINRLKFSLQGTKIFQYCTCPAGPVTHNFLSSCKHMHLSFKSVCNKEHQGVICNMTSSSYPSQCTRPTGRVLWEELL